MAKRGGHLLSLYDLFPNPACFDNATYLPKHNFGTAQAHRQDLFAEDVDLNIVGEVDSSSTLISIAESGDAGTILPLSALSGRDSAHVPVARKLTPASVIVRTFAGPTCFRLILRRSPYVRL